MVNIAKQLTKNIVPTKVTKIKLYKIKIKHYLVNSSY